MERLSPSDSTRPGRILPAWAFSVTFHGLTLLLLGLAVQQAPRGAAEEPGRTAGIVLKTDSAEGSLYEGEREVAVEDAAETAAQVNLQSVLPAEAAVPNAAGDLPRAAAAGAGAPTGGAPSAGGFTSGERRSGSPGGGSQATVTVFGVAGTGTRFVYVFDRSTSMEGAPLAAAKRQLIDSLESLDSVHQFQIIFFNTRTSVLDIEGRGRMAFATDRSKQLARNFVGGITAGLGTDRAPALEQALAFNPDVIFFLTDAEDAMSGDEMRKIRRLNERVGASICVIEFGRLATPPRDNFLIQLAQESGGRYGYVNAARLGQ
jgi:hypothetical protein